MFFELLVWVSAFSLILAIAGAVADRLPDAFVGTVNRWSDQLEVLICGQKEEPTHAATYVDSKNRF
ncbi:MAG: hypothetical protein IJE10_11400 [Clostridia bacterium]|nr:hypothetical protein [Clostridia bacterium]